MYYVGVSWQREGHEIALLVDERPGKLVFTMTVAPESHDLDERYLASSESTAIVDFDLPALAVFRFDIGTGLDAEYELQVSSDPPGLLVDLGAMVLLQHHKVWVSLPRRVS